MVNDGAPSDTRQMMQRAQRLALGLADTGLSQAEEMLRRVSPEGRAQARRERLARARRRNRLLVRLALAALASLVASALLMQLVVPAIALSAAIVMMVLLTMIVLSRAGRPWPDRVALADAGLATLPGETIAWLSGQRRVLPASAISPVEALNRRLDEMTPQLARLDPRKPAADAIRKLVAIELPDLLDGWRAVPPSLRAVPRADGRTPNMQLVDGLCLIDDELARMTEQLSRGALDEVATQGRYLELKYRGDADLRG